MITNVTDLHRENHKAASPLLTAEEAGQYLHVHRRTLANWRVLGRGPCYVRSGSRALYRQTDLDAWLVSHTFAHSADERSRRAGGGL